jgi:hypothetical protein
MVGITAPPDAPEVAPVLEVATQETQQRILALRAARQAANIRTREVANVIVETFLALAWMEQAPRRVGRLPPPRLILVKILTSVVNGCVLIRVVVIRLTSPLARR